MIGLRNLRISEVEEWIRGIVREEIERLKAKKDNSKEKVAKVAAVLLAISLIFAGVSQAAIRPDNIDKTTTKQWTFVNGTWTVLTCPTLYGPYKSECSLPALSFAGVSGSDPDISADGLYYDFDASTDESIQAPYISIPSYTRGAQTVQFALCWTTSGSSLTQKCEWDVVFNIAGNGEAFTSDETVWVYQTNGGANKLNVTDWTTLTTGLSAGDCIKLKVTRDANDATYDTLAADAEFGELRLRIYTDELNQ